MTSLPPNDSPAPDAQLLDAPGMDTPAPPPPEMIPLPNLPPAAPAKQPGRLRTAIPIIVIVAFLGVVLYAVRNNQDAGDLAVGTCFDVPTSSDFSTVEKLGCTVAHDAEVILVAEYTDGDAYPIELAIDRFLSDRCFSAFETYVGIAYDDSTAYDMSYFMPTRDAWSDGERTFTCYVHDVNGAKLTKSVKGAGS